LAVFAASCAISANREIGVPAGRVANDPFLWENTKMAKRTSKEETGGVPSFEHSLKRLEEIVHLLEEGDLGLDEAMKHYEEGVKLLRQSYELLDRAERKIELLSGVDAEGNPVTHPFDDTATFPKGEG
jgi:exodeoxyribonuclease VII small subunit